MNYDLGKLYSEFYANIRTEGYRREFIRWLRDNNPAALNRVVKDHKVDLDGFHFVL